MAEAARRRRPDRAPAPAALHGVRGGVVRERAPDLDMLIHHRLRLGILSALGAAESLTFSELKSILKTTDGNLSVHARKLEEASYVTCTKRFEDRRPKTEYRLASAGRDALHRYLAHMEAIIRTTRDTLRR